MISLNSATLLSGNGIDVNSLVNAVQAPEQSQVQLYQQQQSTLQTQAGLLNTINGHMNSLSSAVNSLADILGPLTAQTVESSEPGIVTGSAQVNATPGTHTVVVSTLATQGTIYTQPVPDANTSILPNGQSTADLEIQVGGAGGATHDVAISTGTNDTLSKIASYINSQNWGVTASVLSDASGARLAVYSQATGTTGALAVANNTTALSFNAPLGGTDASFSVDGIPFSSTTNTVTGAIPGVTLNLEAAIASVPVQVSVGPDVGQAMQAIGNFVSAYNTLVGDINQQFTVDPSTNSEGPLGGDNTLRLLQSSLLSAATYSTGTTDPISSLASLGITMNNDGTLSVDQTQLGNAIATNPSCVVGFFQNASQNGFGNNFARDLQNLTDPTLGLINLDLLQNQQQQSDIGNTITDLQDRIASQQAQLGAEFSLVNALIEEYPFQLQAIDMQLGIQPSSSGNTAPAQGVSG
ncbi:MAG TPA: flagellar filament capping protein FliD [Terriglobales bacterium]|nr:flagellar filament capping protein FliD [Terriglobales bacterium]